MASDEMTTKEAESLSVEETLARLGVDEHGLSSEEAKARLDRFGPNTIEEHHVHPMIKFLLHFWGPIPWMIEVAAVLSGIVEHWVDLGIIVVLLLVNAIIGFWQEHKADNAIAMLKCSLALKAQVRRDKSWQTMEANSLVPGDVVRVRLGDIIPADIKLIAGDYLEVDQSALTGESLPVEKHTEDVSYSGSVVHRGEMDGVIVGTAMNTYLGTTARLVQETTTVSHYQKAVLRIGHFLVLITLVLVGLILMVAMFRHTPLLETAQFALILTVAAIPVALPAVLSVTMAVGAVRLSRFKAIVSRLVSIEEMAGMDVLCSDKTGTLTQNRLVVGDPVTFGSASSEDVLGAAALASRQENPDPIDRAVFEKLGAPETSGESVIESYQPFDPVSKRSEATVRDGDCNFKVTKGAPQVILGLCENRDGVHEAASKAVDELATRGYRTLGVARAEKNEGWQFMGLLPLHDPPREDSADTIRAAKEQGVTIKMVTGDHQAIAREVAGELGLSENIITADAFSEQGGQAEGKMIEDAGGFAQVLPEHKHRIVDVLISSA